MFFPKSKVKIFSQEVTHAAERIVAVIQVEVLHLNIKTYKQQRDLNHLV